MMYSTLSTVVYEDLYITANTYPIQEDREYNLYLLLNNLTIFILSLLNPIFSVMHGKFGLYFHPAIWGKYTVVKPNIKSVYF